MEFYANPYNTSAHAFYFETYDEFLKKSLEVKDSSGLSVDEFEIDVIDGDQEEVQMIKAIKIDQSNMEEVIEFIETSDRYSWPSIFYLLDNHLVATLEDAIRKASELCVVESSLLDAASEVFDECYGDQIPDAIKSYIDYESFARDMQLGGDMREFEFAGKTYTCTNANI